MVPTNLCAQTIQTYLIKLASYGFRVSCITLQIPNSHSPIGVFRREPTAIRTQIQKVNFIGTFLPRPPALKRDCELSNPIF